MFGKDEDDTELLDDESSGGKGKVFALLVAAVGALGFFWKRKRERELDEALWEEPRAL